MRPTPNALSTILCRSQSVPSRLRPMATGTGDAAVAGSVVTSSSASAAHDRCGTSLMEALLLGAGGVLIEAMEWEPGLGEPPVIRARGGGRECNSCGKSLRDCDSRRQVKTRCVQRFHGAKCNRSAIGFVTLHGVSRDVSTPVSSGSRRG